jgi:Zn-dependent protease/CBS domain-containing protein
MFGKQIRLFKLFGFQVGIDWSWIIIAVLVAWSLSTGFFPFLQEDLSTRTYWVMGIVGALGLFLSIIVHEMFHSLVARRFGMPMRGITLFIFGGVAQMEKEPPSPRAEFMMAIVGPISSILIGLFFYAVYTLGQDAWSRPVNGVVLYLAIINGFLAGFNLIPAFPLDGGRVLRSILWKAKNNLRWATRVSSWIGSAFGILLIVLGVFSFLRGNIIGGMWWFVIGLFLRSAASTSYQQLLIRRALEGEPVRRFMSPDPITVPSTLPVRQLVEDYVYKFHHKMFPVVDDGNLLGCVTTRGIKEVPRGEWDLKKTGDLVAGCRENSIEAGADAMQALSKMSRNRSGRLMVVENTRLVGVLSLKDLLQFISLRVELED